MNGRILIIEDDLDFAGQLKTLMESKGYSAGVALTAADGLRNFRDWPADLVLLDLKLPGVHGIRVAEDLRMLPGGADVPIFLMSAVYRRPELFGNDMNLLGIEIYLPKPFSFDVLARRIGEVLASADQGRAAVRDLAASSSPSDSRAYARADSAPAPLHDALEGDSLSASLGAEDSSLRVDSARRLPRSGDMTPEIWVRILTTVFHSHSCGRLVRMTGGKQRTIYLLNGYPVWAEGPSPKEGVLRFFRVEGVLDAEMTEHLAVDLAGGEMSLRGLLLATGKLNDDDLDGLLEDWVAEEVRNTLRHRGEFEFVQSDEFVGKIPVYEVNPIPVLWEGLEGSVDRGVIRRSVDELSGRSLGRTRNFDKMFGYVGAAPSLKAVGELLEHPRSLRQIRAQFPNDPAINLSVWFLIHAGLVAVSDSPSPAVGRAPQRGAASRRAEVQSPSADSQASPADAAGPDEEPGGMEVEFEVRSGSASRAVARTLQARLEGEASSPSALVELHHATRLDLDHYSFVGVKPDATLEEIDAAYQVLAPRYRLRNLGPEASDALRAQAKDLLARLVNAFSDLSDVARRRAYDRLMERELQGVARASKAEESGAFILEDATSFPVGLSRVPPGVVAVDLSDWLPGGGDPSELRKRCARLDEVEANTLREAREAMAAGAFETAFRLLDSLRESHPSDVLLLADIAWCRFSADPDQIRTVDKAIEWVDLGLAFEPSNSRALAVKARILCYALREEEAYACLKRLAPLMPEADWVRAELGRRNDSPEGIAEARGLKRFWGARK
jgi:CheY-like chemotaxis protein/tetratricopeptide (TPR) repeat protein